MMAELMAQSAEECSKRSDVFANSCPHPDTGSAWYQGDSRRKIPWSSVHEPEAVWAATQTLTKKAPRTSRPNALARHKAIHAAK